MLNIVKNTTYPNLFDLIAPHSCRGCGCLGPILCNRCKNYILKHKTKICPYCKQTYSENRCQKCSKLPQIYIVGERSGLLDDVIHAYKYESIRSLAHPLAELFDQSIPTFCNQTIIVPLPTIESHIRSRGFDHTKLIAKHFHNLRRANTTVQYLLSRAKNTIQVGKSKQTRQHQAAEAYKINPKYQISPQSTYLLLDDVWTTGASIESCIKILKQNGAKHVEAAILGLSTIN